MKLSILMPVYNERTVVERCISLVLTAPLPENMERELVIVDDCSTDGTYAILQRLAAAFPQIRLFRHAVNRGKGAAVRTAIEKATGDFSLIQDADLEYDPSEYPRLLRPLLDGHADAVFGSRYMAGEQSRVLPFWHSMINKGLTLVSNMFCNLNLTDMETCYKVFRTDLLKSIPIRSDRFGFEPEIVMKSAKRKFRIYEVPISYHGRTYEEGKKIGWKDGIKAFAVIFKFWLIDDLYAAPYGRGVLNNLTGHAAVPELAGAQAAAARGRRGARDRRRHRQSDRPPDVAPRRSTWRPRKIRCTCTRCATASCARPNVAVQRIDPEVPGDLAGPGELFRHGALPQRAGAPGRCRAGAGIAGRHHPAGRLAAGAGAQRPGRLWLAGSQNGPQAPLQSGDRPRRPGGKPGLQNAGRGLAGWDDSPVGPGDETRNRQPPPPGLAALLQRAYELVGDIRMIGSAISGGEKPRTRASASKPKIAAK